VATKGKKLLTCQTIEGADVSVPVRQIKILDMDLFADLLKTEVAGRKIGPGEQANGFVKLFTGLSQDVIDSLDHDSINAIVEEGLVRNSGFFGSYPASLQKGLARVKEGLLNPQNYMEATQKGAWSPSTSGSSPASTQPVEELKSPGT
jgi:hypothetical protein